MSTTKQAIHTPDAPEAIGSYSQAIQVGNTVYISGQIPLIPQTMHLSGADIESQTRQVFYNLQAICSQAGGSLNHLVKIQIFLTDLTHFPVVNNIMADYFSAPFPARATIEVSRLPKDVQIEVDGIMVLN